MSRRCQLTICSVCVCFLNALCLPRGNDADCKIFKLLLEQCVPHTDNPYTWLI